MEANECNSTKKFVLGGKRTLPIEVIYIDLSNQNYMRCSNSLLKYHIINIL